MIVDWLTAYRNAKPPMFCSSYDDGEHQCRESAKYWLYSPDRKPNPGGHLCKRHAIRVIKSMHKHLLGKWTLKEVYRALAEMQASKTMS